MSSTFDHRADAQMGTGFVFGESPFYFVRHGETFESRQGILQGQTETQLSETGRRSAEALAKRLQKHHLGSIYSSPLDRAWATASIISALTKTPVQASPGLKERHWGIYQGKPKIERPGVRDPRTVETLDLFSSRVMAALRSIKGPVPVLVVSHSGVFRVLLQQIGVQRNSTASIASARLVKIEPPTMTEAVWRVADVDA